jgi:hypothetical protein
MADLTSKDVISNSRQYIRPSEFLLYTGKSLFGGRGRSCACHISQRLPVDAREPIQALLVDRAPRSVSGLRFAAASRGASFLLLLLVFSIEDIFEYLAGQDVEILLTEASIE